ncbi:MAG TPA: serine hydrolase domain-containing protein [Gemmatimonadaceae bacterium]|nr:serine hydrolase domain-containing protein [Gemmatimonadaceae bacterium]
MRDYVNAQLQWRLIPGLSMAVARGGRIVRTEAFGLANRESGDSVRASTIFQLGSVGKQFTAAAIMLLVQDGRIKLDDLVSKHIRPTPASWRDITIRHLLTHTSGLGNYVDAVADLSRDFSASELIELVASQPLLFATGTAYRYSNSGYLLLGLIVEAVSGKPLADYLSERVFTPLGMNATGVVGRGAWPVAQAAQGYRLAEGSPVKAAVVSRSLNSTGDGSVYSTLSDLIKWDAALYTDFPLTSASRNAMWQPVRLNDGTPRSYGFGWSIARVRERRVVEHGGQWQGFAAHIVRYPDDSVTVVVLMNLTGLGNTSGVIANRIARYYIPALRAQAWPRESTTALDTATLNSYTGNFQLGNSQIRIWREDTRLFISATGRGTARLIPASRTEFSIAVEQVRLRFRSQPGRKPDLYVRDGRERLATRIR